MKYSIWSNLDNKSIFLIDKLAKKYNIDKDNIEIFLSYPWNDFSLNRSIKKDISKKDFIKHIRFIQYLWYKINYVINSPSIEINRDFDIINEELILLEKLWINILTITNLELLKKIQLNHTNFKIVLSTVLNIDSILKLNNLFKEIKWVKINRIICWFKVNKSMEVIKKISDICMEQWIEIELLADQGCFLNCTFVEQHYIQDHRNKEKFECPYNFDDNNYLNSNCSFITPELTSKYEKIWVKFFKIATRNCSVISLYNSVKNYFSKKFTTKYSDKLGC